MNEIRRILLNTSKSDLLTLIFKMDQMLINSNGIYNENSLHAMLLPIYKYKEDIRLPIIKDKQ